METKADFSYGVVPLYKQESVWQVLLIHQRSYRGDTFWILPKGHAENGEAPEVTAKRELEEETGLKNVSLDPERIFTISYSFIHEGVKIDKEVQYFIGYCKDQDTLLTQPEEVVEMRWCTFEEARALVSHKNSRDILTQVEAFLYKD